MENTQYKSSVFEVIFSRRSLRRYLPQPVPRSLLEEIITSATWAPSAHNRQPWRFVVVENADRKERLAAVMGERLRRDLLQDDVPLAVIEKDVARSYERIASAPVAVVVCLTMTDMDAYPDERRSHNEYVMAVQSVAMAGQNLLLAAHNAGLGACWACAPLFCPDAVQDVLGLSSDWQPQGLITLGYPAETRTKDRRPLDDVALWK